MIGTRKRLGDKDLQYWIITLTIQVQQERK